MQYLHSRILVYAETKTFFFSFFFLLFRNQINNNVSLISNDIVSLYLHGRQFSKREQRVFVQGSELVSLKFSENARNIEKNFFFQK